MNWSKNIGNFGNNNIGKQRLNLIRLPLVLIIVAGCIFIFWKSWSKYYQKSSVSEGIIGVYTQNNLPSIVTNLASKSLVVLDDSGKPEPSLAASWQVNNNATLYTFKLRNNLFWNDGSKVRSSQIKFNLHDVDVSYPDESSIVFKLADSFYPFPTLLTSPVFKENSLIGIGDFNITVIETSRNLVTKLILTPIKNNDLPQLLIRFYPDEKIAKTAFEIGEVNALIGITNLAEFSQEPSVHSKSYPNFNKIVAIFYDTKDKILSDKNMRKALSFASPEVENEEKAKTSISPKSWAFNDNVKDLEGDQETAKTYLSKVSSGADSTITLTTTPSLSILGEKIIQSWKKSGISGVLRIESGIPQNFQALLLSQAIPLDPDQYSLWHSTQNKTNISQYSSPRVDKDLEDGRKIGDMEKRKEKYLDFQKVVLDDSPATFLYFPKSYIIYRQRAKDNLGKMLPMQIPQFSLF